MGFSNPLPRGYDELRFPTEADVQNLLEHPQVQKLRSQWQRMWNHPRGRAIQRGCYNLRMTLICALITILVMRGTFGAGKYGTPMQDVILVRRELQNLQARRLFFQVRKQSVYSFKLTTVLARERQTVRHDGVAIANVLQPTTEYLRYVANSTSSVDGATAYIMALTTREAPASPFRIPSFYPFHWQEPTVVFLLIV